ncbi:hypothetical protein [Limosilactobacillus fermentum]
MLLFAMFILALLTYIGPLSIK